MKITLAEHRGFCYGVERAVALARECFGNREKTATLGPIIHNPQMVEHLDKQGVGVIHDLEEISSGTVIIRSHGVGPEIYAQAEKKSLHVVDATCPHVRKAQLAAASLEKAGYQVIVVGDKNHPEIRSIVAWANNSAIVVETKEEAENLPHFDKIGIVSQTTFPVDRFDNMVVVLKEKSDELRIERTICTATEKRQQAAASLASTVDAMVIVGGKNSANTVKLTEICRATCRAIFHIETAAELNIKWFRGVSTAGITAGASTPDWIIEEVYQKMQEFAELLENDVKALEQGSLVEGKIVGVKDDEVFVDIGYKAEGVIPLTELGYPQPLKAADVAVVGDVVTVYVLDVETMEGTVKLSKVKADQIIAWEKLEQSLEGKSPVEGKILEAVKGGLVVAVYGVRGFIPASQADIHYVESFEPFIGQTLSLLPIEVDQEKNRVVLSRRLLLEEERRKKEEEIYSKIQQGQVIKGTVRRLADFGVFVDIGGVDGLVHISDLAWHRVKTPSEIVAVGDEVEVAVLKVDEKARKISLSLKAVQQDPWFDVIKTLAVGKVVQGKVTKLSKFGAFAEVAQGVEGLIHLSELDERRVAHAEEAVSVGQLVPVKILAIDTEQKRVSLSVIQARQEAERAEFMPFLDKEPQNLGFTIGDKLGHLFKEKK